MLYVHWILYSLGYLFTAGLFLWLAKKLFDLLTPYSVDLQLTEKDNPALGITLVGYLLGVAAIICGVFSGETVEPTLAVFKEEIVPVVIYGALGMVLLFVAGIINDKVVLNQFSNQKEIAENRNTAVATVMGAAYTGSGLIIAGGIVGSLDLQSALAAFVVGQLALTIFARIYQAVTKYDDQEELGARKNLAAGLGYAGHLLAYSIILMKGLAMNNADLISWTDRLIHVAYYAVAGCILLFLIRLLNDRLFLPKAKLSEEIARDRNISAGVMEAGLAMAAGCILNFCL
ncbi:MAG: DUF350 domain-containing protein [Verrucomicrobiota bacterium]